MSEAKIDEFPCIFPASREFRVFRRDPFFIDSKNSETSSHLTLPSSRQSVSRGISPCGIEKPAVAAGARGPARRQAGRDAEGSSTSRQLPVVSLSGPIPVPQRRQAVRDRGCTGAPREVGLAM